MSLVNVKYISDNETIDLNQSIAVYIIDSTANSITIVLPDLQGAWGYGIQFSWCKGSNPVTLVPSTGYTINGESYYNLVSGTPVGMMSYVSDYYPY